MTDVKQGSAADELVREIARELYDRFVMGGWEPQDAYPQIREWLGSVQPRWIEGVEWMRSEAAKICRVNFNECNARPNCHSKDEAEILALPLPHGPNPEGSESHE